MFMKSILLQRGDRLFDWILDYLYPYYIRYFNDVWKQGQTQKSGGLSFRWGLKIPCKSNISQIPKEAEWTESC